MSSLGDRPARRLLIVHCAGAALAVLALVVLWSSVADAAPVRARQQAPDQNPDEVRCLKDINAVLPDVQGGMGSLATVYQTGSPIEAARRLMWGLQWMGLGIPGVEIDIARLQEDVQVRGPAG